MLSMNDDAHYWVMCIIGRDIEKKKVLSLEWKSEWVMEYNNDKYEILQLNALHDCHQHL